MSLSAAVHRIAGGIALALLVLVPGCAGAAEFVARPFELVGGNPDVESIFPGPDSLLATDNDVLEAVIDSGEYLDNFNRVVDAQLLAWEADTGYERRRDVAIALAAAERPDQARSAADGAASMAATGSFAWTEIRLVRSLLEMRLGSSDSSRFLDEACSAADEHFTSVCLHIRAMLESQFGTKATAAAAMMALRRSDRPLAFPVVVVEGGAEWDPIRTAVYDVLRHRYGDQIDTYGRGRLEQGVSFRSYNRLRKQMLSFGAASTEAGEAINELVQVELLHGNAERSAFWLDLFREQVLVRMANRWEDFTQLELANHRDRAAAAVLAGDDKLAKAEADAAIAIIAKDSNPLFAQVRKFYLASALDMPGQSDLAASIFLQIWNWASSQPEGDYRDYVSKLSAIELMPPPRNGGQVFDDQPPEPLSYERPDVLRYSAGVRLMLIAAATADLPSMERYRIPLEQLADAIDAEAQAPIYSIMLRIVTADAIRHLGTPARLAEAKAILSSVGDDLKQHVQFPSGEPRIVMALWNLIARKIDSDVGISSVNRAMPIARRIEWRYLEALARTEMAANEPQLAKEHLETAFYGLVEEAMVSGRPLRQARMAVDLARLAETLRNDAELGSWSSEALAGMNIVNAGSRYLADILSARSISLASTGDLFGAEAAMLRAISIRESFGRTANPERADDQFRLAQIYRQEGDVGAALNLALDAYELWQGQPSRELNSARYGYLEALLDQLGEAKDQSWAPSGLLAKAFDVAQVLQASRAGLALEAAAKRAAVDNPALREALQQYGEINRRRQALTQRFADLFGQTGAGEKLAVLEAMNKELAKIDEAARQMTSDAAGLLAQPDLAPVDIGALRAGLGPNDALAVLALGADRGWAWVITSDQPTAWYDIGDRTELLQALAKLRCQVLATKQLCTLDQLQSQIAAIASARGVEVIEEPSPLDFDFDLASAEFDRLFGRARSIVDTHRHLILVVDNHLSGLPFQTLLTGPVEVGLEGQRLYREAPWLIRSNAITVLPIAASLLLGPEMRGEGFARPFLGVGDPSIGSPGQIDCAIREPDPSVTAGVGGMEALLLELPTSDGLAVADTSKVRGLSRLYDTRCELESIAASLGASTPDALLLQANATETRIKAMSAEGALDGYGIIVFATHGLVAGELGIAEPALVLTPPAGEGTTHDDGLLTASEIAALRLSADWVVLSACNTAASDGSTGESLSGLARAFFYAGSRSLLVSSWPVLSSAATRLTTATFQQLRANPGIARAEALRRSMEAVLTDPASTMDELLPYYWAPFSLVGNS